MLPAYPKLHNFGPRATLNADDQYVVEEKVDGSQFSFGVIDGVLRMRSKGAQIDIDHPPAIFLPAVQTVQVLHVGKQLRPGFVYRAEAVCKPKHNALTYSRTPNGGLVIFDIEDEQGNTLSYHDKKINAQAMGLEVVPALYLGPAPSVEEFGELLQSTSFLGGVQIEGLVFKAVEPSFMVYGGQAMRYIVKYVREDFKEINGKNWKAENPGKKEALAAVISQLATEARWVKAVRHLEDEGLLEDSPRDIGKLVAEIQRDVLADSTEVGDLLVKAFAKEIGKGVTAGFAQWYKDQLVTEALSDA